MPNCFFIGLTVVFGFVLGQAVAEKHATIRSDFKAKSILILVWLITGYFFSCGYKSVLLSTLVSIEYEKPIDSVQDMLKSEKLLLVNSFTNELFLSKDPREKFKHNNRIDKCP